MKCHHTCSSPPSVTKVNYISTTPLPSCVTPQCIDSGRNTVRETFQIALVQKTVTFQAVRKWKFGRLSKQKSTVGWNQWRKLKLSGSLVLLYSCYRNGFAVVILVVTVKQTEPPGISHLSYYW